MCVIYRSVLNQHCCSVRQPQSAGWTLPGLPLGLSMFDRPGEDARRAQSFHLHARSFLLLCAQQRVLAAAVPQSRFEICRAALYDSYCARSHAVRGNALVLILAVALKLPATFLLQRIRRGKRSAGCSWPFWRQRGSTSYLKHFSRRTRRADGRSSRQYRGAG